MADNNNVRRPILNVAHEGFDRIARPEASETFGRLAPGERNTKLLRRLFGELLATMKNPFDRQL